MKKFLFLALIAVIAFAACQNGVQEVEGDLDATTTSALFDKPEAPSAVTRYAAPNASSGYFTFTGVEGATGYSVYWRYADQNLISEFEYLNGPTSVVNYTTYAGDTKAPDNTYYVRINTFPGTAVGVDAIAAQNVQFGISASKSGSGKDQSEIVWGPAIANK